MKSALVFLACMVSATAASTTESPPTCGNTEFYNQTGVITSPNHPEYYPYNLNCSSYIHASTGSSFSFIFTSFNVEAGFDFVTFICPTNSSYIPQKASGWYGFTSVPGPVSMPWCSQAQVHFSSDSSMAGEGFSLNYYVSYGGCGNTLFNESTGYVTSPSYPESYGSDQNCSTIIYAPQRGTFYLYFHEFEVEDDCTHDWMEISCLDNAEYGHHKLCGNHKLYEAYIYECSQLLLWFHSDGSNNYQGFNIEYRYMYLKTTEQGQTTTPPPVQACGNTDFNGPTGVITSPNHPYYYPYNLNCSSYINASTGSSFSFIFTSFNVEAGFDFVTFICPTNSSYIPQKVSGWYGFTSVPGPVSIPWCSQAQVHFSSNSIMAGEGFSLNYYVSYGGCGNTLFNESTGFVTSPSYPENYGSDQNCSTIVYAPQRDTFYLYFHEFEVEDDCTHDWMEISCMDNADYGRYKLCGNHKLYEAYIYECSQLLLWFHSDGSNNYQGFNIEYSYTNSSDSKVPIGLHGKPSAEEGGKGK